MPILRKRGSREGELLGREKSLFVFEWIKEYIEAYISRAVKRKP